MIFLLRTHAGFMILALCIMITGATIARFMKKKPWWLKSHRSLGITGAIFILTGFFAIALQITLTEREHFRVVHSSLVRSGPMIVSPSTIALSGTMMSFVFYRLKEDAGS